MTSTSSPDPTKSPLAQAKARSLDEIFAAEVDTLSDADIESMISALRANRAFFKQAKQAKPKVAAIPHGSVDELMDILDLNKKLGE